MKTYLPLLATLFASCCLFKTYTQESPGLTLVNSMPSEGAVEITLHLDGNVQVEFWDKTYLQVQLSVEKSNLSRSQLKSLVRLGFFQVAAAGNANGLALFMPKAATPVTVSGMKPCNELAFKITVPRHVRVKVHNERSDSLALEAARL